MLPNLFNQLKENTVEPHCFALLTGRLSVHHFLWLFWNIQALRVKPGWCSSACWFTSVECYNSALFPILEVHYSIMENESKRGSTATLFPGMWTDLGLILNGGLARFYCNLYKMYKTRTFPRIRPLILPLAIGSEKLQVKKPSLHYKGVFEAKKTKGRSIKAIVLSSLLFVFQYNSASCRNYSVGRNFSLFSLLGV